MRLNVSYCQTKLCRTANEFESDKDSLTDFVEKLQILKTNGKIGEWNHREDVDT